MRIPQRNFLARSGFTTIELIMIVTIIGILAGIAGPAMSRIVRHSRTNRAALVIAADLQNAFAAAARQRKPVSIVADSAGKSYQFIDRKTSTVLKVRSFYGGNTDYQLQRLVFSPGTIDVFPTGVSSAPLVIDLANGDYARRITVSTAGFIRLVPK